MAHATVKGQRYNVRVTQDLTDNFSLEVYPAPDPRKEKVGEPFKNWPVPLCLKIRADSKEDALVFGLEHMKKLGTIDDFHVEPNERPAPPAAAAAKPKKEEDEAEA
jgi:hypothetical protein